MVRTIVQLTEEQAKSLRERAKKESVSASALVRQFVAAGLAIPAVDDERRRRALQVIGCVKSGTGDVSERHDEIFAESVQSQ
ncbi:MAG: CopG family transcriptional regulator [Armatimonadota bacterium]|nr:CopG family transcriptional regulator [Armatimonadota bacterium]